MGSPEDLIAALRIIEKDVELHLNRAKSLPEEHEEVVVLRARTIVASDDPRKTYATPFFRALDLQIAWAGITCLLHVGPAPVERSTGFYLLSRWMRAKK